MPPDVDVKILQDNINLFKEIDEQRNSKTVQDIKNIYHKRFNELKDECELAKDTKHNKLMCFNAFLYYSNEKEILKKIILDEAFKEV